jgi:hypothetical protein
MLMRVAASVVVGVVTWIVVALVGILVSRFLDGQVGSFITGVAVLLGFLAAVWFYVTGRTLSV